MAGYATFSYVEQSIQDIVLHSYNKFRAKIRTVEKKKQADGSEVEVEKLTEAKGKYKRLSEYLRTKYKIAISKEVVKQASRKVS